jgi:glycosyltransferase involved in cell wall biosynthesis
MTKKKILLILHVPPPVHGAAMVGKYIVESTVINERFELDYINLSTSRTMNEVGKGGFGKIVNLMKIQKKVIRALRSKRYDLCYVTLTASGPGFKKDLMVVAILKLFKKKILYHFHNKGVAADSKNSLNDRLYRYAFKNTKSILLSPGLYGDFKKYLKEENVYFCPNGIPAPKTPEPSGVPEVGAVSACRLLFLSNMIIEKGVLVLLEACRILKEKALDFECHFVGAWSNISEPEFRQQVNNSKLAQNVYAHGAKFGDEKNAMFNATDVFVLPTYYSNECFPLVLLEAMGYGLPVVSTAEGGIPDIVVQGETGFIVPQKNAVELASRLEALIKDPELRSRFGSAGRKQFLDRFTTETFESNMAEIFSRSISEQ